MKASSLPKVQLAFIGLPLAMNEATLEVLWGVNYFQAEQLQQYHTVLQYSLCHTVHGHYNTE